MPGETIGTKTKNKTFYETFPWRKKIFVNAFIDNDGFPQDFSPSCLVSHELQYHKQCNAVFACFRLGHNCTKYKPLLKSTSKEKTSLCLREKQFSSRWELHFSLLIREKQFSSRRELLFSLMIGEKAILAATRITVFSVHQRKAVLAFSLE